MTTDHRQPASTTLSDESSAQDIGEWILAVSLFGLLVLGGIRQGGFWPADAFVVAVASVVVFVVAAFLVPPDRRSMALVAGLVLLALWWLVRGHHRDVVLVPAPRREHAGVCGGLRRGAPARRPCARTGPVSRSRALGAAGALVGFAGLVWRWYPLAIPSQGLWRLSSTLTYSDAAGLALGICLLVALGVDLCPPLVRVTVCLCVGGLLATQSRGAYVAVACACLLVPWRRYVRFAVPLVAGAALGAAAVASSPGAGTVPWLAAVVVVTTSVSAFVSWDVAALGLRVTAAARAVPAVIAAAVVVVAAGLHHEIGLRALAPSDQDRTSEWSAALHQWGSNIVAGVGPDRLLTFHAADGTFAHFAHNEYLQIAAGAGLIGLVLVLFTAFAATRVVRRFDSLSSCATAALVCFLVGGAFDFDWHLPVLGLLGGCCVGLATRRDVAT